MKTYVISENLKGEILRRKTKHKKVIFSLHFINIYEYL